MNTSKVERILTEAQFIAKIWSALYGLGKELFKRTKGDPAKAKEEIRRIPDHWQFWDAKQARIDAKMEALDKEGK